MNSSLASQKEKPSTPRKWQGPAGCLKFQGQNVGQQPRFQPGRPEPMCPFTGGRRKCRPQQASPGHSPVDSATVANVTSVRLDELCKPATKNHPPEGKARSDRTSKPWERGTRALWGQARSHRSMYAPKAQPVYSRAALTFSAHSLDHLPSAACTCCRSWREFRSPGSSVVMHPLRRTWQEHTIRHLLSDGRVTRGRVAPQPQTPAAGMCLLWSQTAHQLDHGEQVVP